MNLSFAKLSFAIGVLALPSVAAVQLEIGFPVIERMLASQMFTQEGRKYVKGTRDTKCSFAYLANPRIAGAAGKLAIHARFTGRSAIDLLGQCIGLGDDFELTVLAAPYWKDGKLAMKDVSVDSHGRDGIYIRRVRLALAATLEREFRYPLEAEARKILEEQRSDAWFRQELSGFQIPQVEVTNDAVVFSLDFRLKIKLIK